MLRDLVDFLIVVFGIGLTAVVYVAVARDEIAKEKTADDEMWARGLDYYRPENQKGAGDESPDAPERRAERDVSARLEDTLSI